MVGVHLTVPPIPLSFTVTVITRGVLWGMELAQRVTGLTILPPATPVVVVLAVREILREVLPEVARTGHRLRRRQCRAGILPAVEWAGRLG
jgi:hypothetical protein